VTSDVTKLQVIFRVSPANRIQITSLVLRDTHLEGEVQTIGKLFGFAIGFDLICGRVTAVNCYVSDPLTRQLPHFITRTAETSIFMEEISPVANIFILTTGAVASQTFVVS